jgi:hypothetical protein
LNIFVTHSDPCIAAQALDDKRLNKMIVESVQMMAYALKRHGSQCVPYTISGKPYRTSGGHRNHPCTLWAGNTRANYKWLLMHFSSMLDEYCLRFNKVHGCSPNFNILAAGMEDIPEGELEDFVNCSRYITTAVGRKSVIDMYRRTMWDKWDEDKVEPKWTKHSPPEWYKSNRR